MGIRNFFFAVLLAVLSACAGAEEAPVLQADGVRLLPVSCHAEPGKCVLELSGDAETETGITVLDPRINGAPAGFRDHWGTDAFTLPAGEGTAVSLELLADDETELPETVSFRFCLNGKITEPAVLCPSSPEDCTAARELTAEHGILAPEVTIQGLPETAYVFTDRLTPEEAAVLDYGQLRIMKGNADGSFADVAVCAASVSEDGTVAACWSGAVLALADDPDFRAVTREDPDKTGILCSAEGITLSGECVFYAELSFDVGKDGTVSGMKVSSAELGGDCSTVPAALFDYAGSAPSVWRFETAGDGTVLAGNEGAEAADYTPDGPMRFAAAPAPEEWDLVCCFEYFFTDGTDTIRPVRAF